MSRLMLDTSAYSALLRGNSTIKSAMQGAGEIYLSTIVLGELFSGFAAGSRRRANEDALQEFLGSPRVHVADVGETTALCYAEIQGALRAAGTPLPTNDIWIAAGAMERGLRVLTTDSHYRKIPQILVDCVAPLP